MGNNIDVRDTVEAEYGSPPVEMARALAEAREALRGYEASALADVAAMLAKAAESLARTARELREMSQDEWMDAERATAYLKRTPKTFRNIVATGEIPKHYLTERGILFSRKELDEWLMSR
jgi:acyl-CoA reductase-like NAD-dependent aldehyde dehydrogenase